MGESDKFKIFMEDSITSYLFFHSDRIDRNVNTLKAFAERHGIPLEMVNKFIIYNLSNGEGGHLCDRQGNLIRNVFGAFIRFAKSGYDRATWEKEHGITVPKWMEEKRRKSDLN